MAKYIGPKSKISRKFGEPIFKHNNNPVPSVGKPDSVPQVISGQYFGY